MINSESMPVSRFRTQKTCFF